MTQAGLIEKTKRGHFVISSRGKQALASRPKRIDNTFLNQFEEFREFKERSRMPQPKSRETDFDAGGQAVADESRTPDEVMRSAYQQINAAVAEELIDRVRAAPPDFFERLIVKLLLSMGYGGSAADKAGRILGGPGDDGVDGVIDQDALGLDRVYLQAKRYAAGNNIGSGAIRDFFGILDRHKASKGIFVTTSAFSKDDVQTAELLSKRIVLIDGNQLATLMVQQNVGCRIEDTLHIKKIDEDFFVG